MPAPPAYTATVVTQPAVGYAPAVSCFHYNSYLVNYRGKYLFNHQTISYYLYLVLCAVFGQLVLLL